MDRLNTVIDKVIEKQVEKNIKMRDHWSNVFSNELIDRMSVIRAINDAYDESSNKESYRDKVTHKMMAIPSAEPKWIPVNEMPKEDGLYLVYTEEQPFVCPFEDGKFFIDEVIAWMPVPKPYEPQESEE